MQRDPERGFTNRVMERVRAEGSGVAEPVKMTPAGRPVIWRWAVAGAMAASLAVGVYVQQDRVRQAGVVADEQAADELMLSLQLAGKKLNKARDAALRRGLGEAAP